MISDTLDRLRKLPDAELVNGAVGLARSERQATASLVAHLAVIDARRLYLSEGFDSLFSFCVSVLRLSEHEAYNRIEVARAASKFPIILELLADGSVNLTTVRLLAPHLTTDNHRGILDSARGKRRRDVEEIVARLSPRPEVRASIRKLPNAEASPRALPTAPVTAQSVPDGSSPPSGPPSPPRTPTLAPLAPDRYKLQLTISGATVEKLRLAQDMLRHAIPSGNEAAIVDRALTLLLEDLARKKFAQSDQPRPSRVPASLATGSRHIPAAEYGYDPNVSCAHGHGCGATVLSRAVVVGSTG